MPDGSWQPYGLNITYYSALAIPEDTKLGAARFLCSQALALSLRGVPGIYIHLLGWNMKNFRRRVKETGQESHNQPPQVGTGTEGAPQIGRGPNWYSAAIFGCFAGGQNTPHSILPDLCNRMSKVLGN